MALVVEDGTGKTDSNAYINVTDATPIITDRDPQDPWLSLTVAQQEASLISGADYLRNWLVFPWRGSRKTITQAMDWPRTGASMRNGPDIPDDIVPQDIALANALLGPIVSVTDITPVIDRSNGNTRREKVDVIETEYFSLKDQGSMPNNPANFTTIVPEISGLLQPYLRNHTSDFLDSSPFADLPPQSQVDRALRPLFHQEMHKNWQAP